MTIDARQSQPRSIPTAALFTVYAVVLTAVILFKFPFSYRLTDSGRIVNLIPLLGSFTHGGVLSLDETVANILIFVPLGIYIGMMNRDWRFARTLRPVVATSVAFELIQYVFAIGRADITDVLSNTLGGALGIGIHAALTRCFKTRTNAILDVAALILTICALVVLAFLFVRVGSPARLAGSGTSDA